jgi:RNA polymerase sigma-70 factor (ECF subfamily)
MDAPQESEICRRYAARIRAYGLRHLRNNAAADDLVQHVLLVVLQALREDRVSELDRLDSYVFGTCHHVVMDMRRGDARQRRIAEAAVAVLPDGYQPAWERVDGRRLEECLGALEPPDRAIVLATFVDDRDSDEIGEAMGLSPGNVRVIRHRAMERLQSCVGGAVS